MSRSTPLYYVNCTGGTSGAFLNALICQIITPSITEPFDYTQRADSHHVYFLRASNFHYKTSDYLHGHTQDHDHIDVINPYRPVVFRSHAVTDWSYLKTRWPNFRAFLIQVPDKMRWRVFMNYYFKIYMDPVSRLNENNSRSFEQRLRSQYDFINDYDDLLTITDQDAQRLCQLESDRLTHSVIQPEFLTVNPPPKDYGDQILVCDLYDLYHRPRQLLQSLYEYLGAEPRAEVEASYHNYLMAQARQCPWLDESKGIGS